MEDLLDSKNGVAVLPRRISDHERETATPLNKEDPPRPQTLLENFVTLVAPLVAVVSYFILGQPLWSVVALGALWLVLHVSAKWRRTTGLTRVLFTFCILDFAINSFGISYPYSNIFILTGLLGIFSLSGMEWKGLYFGPGQTGKWSRTALLMGLALAAVILATYFWNPALLGDNPAPKGWPLDVLLVMALGYATFSALMEETIFRSTIMAFARKHLTPWAALAAQAIVFAAVHYRHGFPTQIAGAGFSLAWGLGAGWLVLKSNSIYPAFLMHFVVILVLFVALVFA